MSPYALRAAQYAFKKQKETVFVGMSGGVDSSVAAYLLKKQDYNVVGVFMRCYNVDGCAERDAEDARRVAEHLDIPFYALDFEKEYKERVVQYMIDGYRAGLTPNPDVMCNREIKFGLFLERALAMGADYVATGHYVRLRRTEARSKKQEARKVSSLLDPRTSLLTARDANKDQSYFLWTLTQDELRHCLFPIGDYEKPEVRELARKAGLPTAEKKDSQGICFLGQVTLKDFLADYLPKKTGAILTPEGEVIGEHAGAHFMTVGQRHVGAAVRNQKKGDTKPHYVVAKDVHANTITVAEGRDNDLLFKKTIKLTEVNVASPLRTASFELRAGLPVLARVRYRQPLAPATLYARTGSTSRQDAHYELIFDKAQQFVAEGQSAVFYERTPATGAGLKMLGGGVIAAAG